LIELIILNKREGIQPLPNWKNPADYDFVEDLAPQEWAWQFLRRNPDYQTDWQWFQATWAVLEAEYGRPPQRDFHRWQKDPRAYRQTVTEQGEAELLLIECWMGQKWGFYKFPIDPAMERPEPGTELLWREVSLPPVIVEAVDADWLGSNPAKMAYGFDLSQPLAPQFAQAQRFLRMLQRQRCKQGSVTLETPQQRRHEWRLYLRYLDAEAAGIPAEQIIQVLQLEEPAMFRQQAYEMIQSGYRRILYLSNTTT
jgi:hypothetical protein